MLVVPCIRRGDPALVVELSGQCAHERLPLVSIHVHYVVHVGDDRDFVFHIIDVESLAVPAHHRRVIAAFLAVQLPGLDGIDEIVWIKDLLLH